MDNLMYSPEELDAFAAEAQQGKTEAFEKLYNAFIDHMYRYMYYRVGKEDALDLTETVFLKVWENIGSYRIGRNYFSAWIYRIAHNIAVDYYRMSKETAPLEYDIPDEKRDHDPILLTQRSLNSDVLRKAFRQLNDRYQQILILTFINDLDNKEAAKIMRRNASSVRILKHRALRALRQILDQMNVSFRE